MVLRCLVPFVFVTTSLAVGCSHSTDRAYDGKGSIEFSLVERAGHETLNADDIANNSLGSPGDAFDFVLFAEEAPDSQQHRARILTGHEGTRRMPGLMGGVKKR